MSGNSISTQSGIHRATMQTWVAGKKPAGPDGLGAQAGLGGGREGPG